MDEFSLDGREFIPLCDLLKHKGYCQTGGHAKMVVADGQVKVDGQVELRKRCKMRVGQEVDFEGQKVKITV